MIYEDDQAYGGHLDVYLAYTKNSSAVDAKGATPNIEHSTYVGETVALSWRELPVNIAEAEDFELPAEEPYEPDPSWDKPPGHAVRGIDAFKLLCSVNDPREEPVVVVGDSGAAPTLISEEYLAKLTLSKPRPRKGGRLNLLQLTGQAVCDHYVRLDLWFRSQLGPVRLKGVEAYVVKGMKANLLIGEDTQSKWRLQTLRSAEGTCWQVGDSQHRIPSIAGTVVAESFAAGWAAGVKAATNSTPMPVVRSLTDHAKANVTSRTVLARIKEDSWIDAESYAAVRCVVRGRASHSTWYLQARTLRLFNDMLVQAPDGLVKLGDDGTFLVYVTNTAKRRVKLRSGEVIGDLCDPLKELVLRDAVDEEKRRSFEAKVAIVEGLRQVHDSATEVEFEHFGGPKTAQPSTEPVYPSERLRELISVDPELSEGERDALYKVLERNQRAFGFDGRLGHLASRVHIDLKPGTKPISMPPYAASPAKREIIDKQIDLWLSQEVIEESKSPWGAPVIIVLRNGKPRLCIDWRRLNAATVADQHPIPRQTDILQALTGAQYLSVFDALSGFTQMEFDEESRPITAIRTLDGEMGPQNFSELCRRSWRPTYGYLP